MQKIISLLGSVLVSVGLMAQANLAERLGYPSDTRLLIIHADDLGVSHSENMGTVAAMEKGVVNSASIMVPTPWFSEIAAYAVAHPKADFGLHLTLTSEWKYYKWGPLAGRSEVPGLINKGGYLFASVDSVYRAAKLAEVEKELRVQIDKALSFGIDVTHFDSHMGALYGDREYLKLLIRLGREYKVPVLLNKSGPRSAFDIELGDFVTVNDVQLDGIFTATPNDWKAGMDEYYTGVIKSLPAGVSELIIHTAYDDGEMRAITVDHPEWGAMWRQEDFNFFTSEACKKLLEKEKVKLVTWREIRDKVVRG